MVVVLIEFLRTGLIRRPAVLLFSLIWKKHPIGAERVYFAHDPRRKCCPVRPKAIFQLYPEYRYLLKVMNAPHSAG
jgi:hypothetical protein